MNTCHAPSTYVSTAEAASGAALAGRYTLLFVSHRSGVTYRLRVACPCSRVTSG